LRSCFVDVKSACSSTSSPPSHSQAEFPARIPEDSILAAVADGADLFPKGLMNSLSVEPDNSPTYYPGRRYYPVVATYVILAVNVSVFILMTLAGGSKNVQVLLSFGASYGPFFRAGEYWRLVMPMFLHIGVAHLATNMFGLVLLGYFLEPLYGYGRFSLIYVLSGMAGSLLSMEASAHIAAGASSAIFGIAGAMLVTGFLHPEAVPWRWKNVFGIGILLVIVVNLGFGHFVKHIDNWAHLGGLLCGISLALLIPPARLRSGASAWSQRPAQPVTIVPATLVVIAIVATASHYVKAGELTSLLQASGRMDALHQPDRALSLLQQAQRIAPHNFQVCEALGALYLERRQYGRAISELEQALRLDPSSSRDAVALAEAYNALHQPQRALSLLQQAGRIAPHNFQVSEALGVLYLERRQYAQAIPELKQALQLEPSSAPDAVALAEAYEDSGQLAQARQVLETAHRKAPEDAGTQEALAELCSRLKLYQAAINQYKGVLKLAPNSAIAHNNLAWLYATCDDPQYRDPKDALHHAWIAVRLSGWRQSEFVDTLAAAFFANGQPKLAAVTEGKALQLAPANQEFQASLARYRKAVGTL
jgi:membrane associated rhomboid family serine protease/tetratricopeptide (TPR) repeat protein